MEVVNDLEAFLEIVVGLLEEFGYDSTKLISDEMGKYNFVGFVSVDHPL